MRIKRTDLPQLNAGKSRCVGMWRADIRRPLRPTELRSAGVETKPGEQIQTN